MVNHSPTEQNRFRWLRNMTLRWVPQSRNKNIKWQRKLRGFVTSVMFLLLYDYLKGGWGGTCSYCFIFIFRGSGVRCQSPGINYITSRNMALVMKPFYLSTIFNSYFKFICSSTQRKPPYLCFSGYFTTRITIPLPIGKWYVVWLFELSLFYCNILFIYSKIHNMIHF